MLRPSLTIPRPQSGDPSQPLHPIAILVDELRSEDVTLRLNAVHRLTTIALALGPDRTREELVGFLLDSLDDEDEVLLALAEETGNLGSICGWWIGTRIPCWHHSRTWLRWKKCLSETRCAFP